MNHSRGFALLPALIAIVTILGISGGAYLYVHKEKPLHTYVDLAPMASSTAESSTISTWKTYRGKAGFEIKYPQNWNVVREESNSVSFGAGTYGNGGYDGESFVFVHDKSLTSVDELIKHMGEQFSDRKEKKENIMVNGVAALKVTVTAPSVSGWVYEQVFFESGNRIYVVSNGAVPNSSFETFYRSFKLVAQTTSNTSTVKKIQWSMGKANPVIVEDDYRKYEQAIAVDVTFADNSVKHYSLGGAYGCEGETHVYTEGGKEFLGKVNCYFALTNVNFFAYNQNGKFIVEKQTQSVKDDSVQTTVLLEI